MQSNGLTRICSVRQVTEMYSVYKRQRILHYERTGHKAPTICRMLREEGMGVSRVGVHKFLQKYKETRSIERRPVPIVFRPNYSRIVLRTVAQYDRSFPYNGRERSVLPAFSKNETLTLYCHILYVLGKVTKSVNHDVWEFNTLLTSSRVKKHFGLFHCQFIRHRNSCL